MELKEAAGEVTEDSLATALAESLAIVATPVYTGLRTLYSSTVQSLTPGSSPLRASPLRASSPTRGARELGRWLREAESQSQSGEGLKAAEALPGSQGASLLPAAPTPSPPSVTSTASEAPEALASQDASVAIVPFAEVSEAPELARARARAQKARRNAAAVLAEVAAKTAAAAAATATAAAAAPAAQARRRVHGKRSSTDFPAPGEAAVVLPLRALGDAADSLMEKTPRAKPRRRRLSQKGPPPSAETSADAAAAECGESGHKRAGAESECEPGSQEFARRVDAALAQLSRGEGGEPARKVARRRSAAESSD